MRNNEEKITDILTTTIVIIFTAILYYLMLTYIFKQSSNWIASIFFATILVLVNRYIEKFIGKKIKK